MECTNNIVYHRKCFLYSTGISNFRCTIEIARPWTLEKGLLEILYNMANYNVSRLPRHHFVQLPSNDCDIFEGSGWNTNQITDIRVTNTIINEKINFYFYLKPDFYKNPVIWRFIHYFSWKFNNLEINIFLAYLILCDFFST